MLLLNIDFGPYNCITLRFLVNFSFVQIENLPHRENFSQFRMRHTNCRWKL